MKIELRLRMETIEELDRISAHLRMLGDPEVDGIPYEEATTNGNANGNANGVASLPVSDAVVPTREQFASCLRQYTDQHGGAALKQLLDRHNARKLSDIPVSDYPLIINEIALQMEAENG